jgi:L-alanine-DL-glutamate epimerase-like enolase superfamily enzyme
VEKPSTGSTIVVRPATPKFGKKVLGDAAVLGGVSEWMKVAALASAYDLPVASHYFHDIHVHLMASVPNALIAEYFPLDLDIMVFDAVVKEPLKLENGYLPVPQCPGLGMDLDEEKLKRYRIA